MASIGYHGGMNTPKPRPSGVRLDPEVQRLIDEICRTEYRQIGNAVNLLLIEALKARGLWEIPANQG